MDISLFQFFFKKESWDAGGSMSPFQEPPLDPMILDNYWIAATENPGRNRLFQSHFSPIFSTATTLVMLINEQ